MEVVVAGFGVVDIATVAQGIQRAEGGGQQAFGYGIVAPGIAPVIGNDQVSVPIVDANYIALSVDGIVIGRAVPGNRGRAKRTIGEVEGVIPHRHLGQLAAVVHIVICGRAVGTACTHPVGIVGICPCGIAIGHGRKFSAVAPGVSPSSVRQQVADLVIGPRNTVVGGQQVTPGIVIVGIGVGRKGCAGNWVFVISKGVFLTAGDVTGIVVSPDKGLV